MVMTTGSLLNRHADTLTLAKLMDSTRQRIQLLTSLQNLERSLSVEDRQLIERCLMIAGEDGAGRTTSTDLLAFEHQIIQGIMDAAKHDPNPESAV